MSKTAKTNTL